MKYYYCIIKSKLKEIDNIEQKSIVLDIPFRTYHQTIKSNGKDMTYSGKVKDVEVLALVSVKTEDKEAIQRWEGYVCDKWEDLKTKPIYTKHYKQKIKDTKRRIEMDKDGKEIVIEYEGADKDEPARFALWEEKKKELQDKELGGNI